MAHLLPPEDENSPASPFAPDQPGAGVVAADVDSDGPRDPSLPGTVNHQLSGQGPEPAKAADAANLPVVEDGKATAPKKADSEADAGKASSAKHPDKAADKSGN